MTRNELPDWAQVGATVYRMHKMGYGLTVSRSAGKIVRRTATQVVAEFPDYRSREEGATVQKRFKMSTSYMNPTLTQIGERYSNDDLVSEKEGLAKIAEEDHDKEVARVQSEITSVGAELGRKTNRWISAKDVDEAIDQLQELRRQLIALDSK